MTLRPSDITSGPIPSPPTTPMRFAIVRFCLYELGNFA